MNEQVTEYQDRFDAVLDGETVSFEQEALKLAELYPEVEGFLDFWRQRFESLRAENEILKANNAGLAERVADELRKPDSTKTTWEFSNVDEARPFMHWLVSNPLQDSPIDWETNPDGRVKLTMNVDVYNAYWKYVREAK